ncbi:MAG TPA: ABC transporter ATP-binding protein [Clostridiaceae bacterium]|nr:ABC transporter ATP-binding protein [Clostridiaceae bacterium]
MSVMLEVSNLRKDFKDFSLKDISFSLERGYIMGFIGANGAGKTTTIKLILNLIKKDGGNINVFGLDNIKYEKEIKNRIGVVFDESYYYGELTISEMKRVIAPFYSNWSDSTFNKYIKDFQLPSDRKIKELSKGMKMKFSLAMALSHEAELLIMDEPTSGLDPIIRSELLDILKNVIMDENKGIFFSTHITSDLDKIADYVTLIDQGEIVLSDSKDQIMSDYVLVKGPKELLNDSTRKAFIDVKENQFGFEGLSNDKQRIRNLFKDKVITEKPQLEDIMLYYTRRRKEIYV